MTFENTLRDLLNRGLAVGARTLLAGMLLSAKGDRVAMWSSVETRAYRMAFMDRPSDSPSRAPL